MAIIKTVTNDYEFWDWLKQSDNYKNNFSFEGANTLQAYLEEYSESLGENIEFDPIAWCCEWSEYSSIDEAYSEHYGDDSDLPEEQRRTTKGQKAEYFTDQTQVIELDNGGVIIQDF